MQLLVVLSCLLAGCLAGKPEPCTSPPLLSGALTVSSQNERLFANVRYVYDAVGKRMRLMEMGTYENKSFIMDLLMLYEERSMYQIFRNNKTCTKMPLKVDFQPMGVPDGATLLGQVVLGSSSIRLGGMLVNSWAGQVPQGGMFFITVTEFGCIPVTWLSQTEDYGWLMMSYFDNVVGISDPQLLYPPDFCPDTDSTEEPADFVSLLFTKH